MGNYYYKKSLRIIYAQVCQIQISIFRKVLPTKLKRKKEEEEVKLSI